MTSNVFADSLHVSEGRLQGDGQGDESRNTKRNRPWREGFRGIFVQVCGKADELER